MDWTGVSYLLVTAEPRPDHPRYWDIGEIQMTFFACTLNLERARRMLGITLEGSNLALVKEVAAGPVEQQAAALSRCDRKSMEKDLVQFGVAHLAVEVPTGGEIRDCDLP